MKGVLNVLPHELSHLYCLLPLDFGTGWKETKSFGITSFTKEDGRIEREGDFVVKDLLQENFGDFCGFMAGKGLLVGASYNSNINKWLRLLGKREPDEMKRKRLINRVHEENHVGAKMMFQMLLADDYYWPSMFNDCARVANRCCNCAKFNAARAGFHPMSTIFAGRPWDHIIWDLIGKLPTSVNGYNYVLIIVDVLTRFVVLKLLRTKSAEEIASRLVKSFTNFGVSKILQCDNDTALENEMLQEIAQR